MSKTFMTLGGYTFTKNPSAGSVITGRRVTSIVETYGGIEFFSWGTFIAGQVLTFKWNFMPSAMFGQLEALKDADEQVVFNPGTGTSYDVQIIEPLYGDYFLDQNGENYQNAILTLVIISEAS